MARIIVLDAGPLGLASKPPGKPDADRCRAWIRTLDTSGVRIVVPEVADYEVRRELIRAGATAGVRRLDRLESVLHYDPITTPAIRHAADFWAVVRNAGLPTAHHHAPLTNPRYAPAAVSATPGCQQHTTTPLMPIASWRPKRCCWVGLTTS